MLVNPRAAHINDHLDRLASGSIQVHAQVVLCPEVNDGPILERTIADLYARGDDVLSLSIVPVGLTEFNSDRGIRPLTPEECRDALDRVDHTRKRALRDRGRGWCYAADEMFLQAERELPESSYFDDHELVANGVGAVSSLAEAIRSDLDSLPDLAGQRIVLLTGRSMRPHLTKLAEEIQQRTGARIDTEGVYNTLYGPLVTTAGLLSGADHARALEGYADHDIALFSRNALNEDDFFLDDLSLQELRQGFPTMRLWPSEHVTDTLRTL
jgi:NifB/MoaA-like Fe-S oxidoreductase